MTAIQRLLTILCVTLAATAVQAQEGGRQAIAFVQAPEMGAGVCVGSDTASAIDCAMRQCMESGAIAEDCQVNATCFPANWSVDVFMMADGGPHWHQYSCGWQTKELALKAADLACSNAKDNNLVECSAVQLVDEEGTILAPPFE